MQSKYRVLDTTHVDYARAVEYRSTLMNTYHKWLSGRSSKRALFQTSYLFWNKKIFHMLAISTRKMETSTFLQTNLTLGYKEIRKIENNYIDWKIARPISRFSSICTITQLSTPGHSPTITFLYVLHIAEYIMLRTMP